MDQVISKVLSGLTRDGFAVVGDVFSQEWCARVRQEVAELSAAGEVRPARVGKGIHRQLDLEVRGDSIRWFDSENLSPVQRELWEFLEHLRGAVNTALFLGLWDLEGHYAVYAPGAFYRKHVDRFKNDSKRTLTVVAFFNEKWRSSDGGCLRMETPGGVIDVLPEAGTFVFFLSEKIPHEVMETHRERLSFAGWFRTRE